MVSLNTVLAIGGIAAAYIIFQSLGGASGIGSKIGGGFATFGTSLTNALNPLSNLSNPFRTGFTENGQFYDTSQLTGSATTPQQRQDSLDKQNDPNLSHDRWEDVITEVCDKYGNCKPYDGSGIINETPQSERNTSFDFFPSAYGDTYNDNRTNQSSFESRGLVSQGYQEPNYSISGAGYTATNFFGNNTPQPTFTGIATSAQKATLSSLTGGLLG
jgi:hypothetical protein